MSSVFLKKKEEGNKLFKQAKEAKSSRGAIALLQQALTTYDQCFKEKLQEKETSSVVKNKMMCYWLLSKYQNILEQVTYAIKNALENAFYALHYGTHKNCQTPEWQQGILETCRVNMNQCFLKLFSDQGLSEKIRRMRHIFWEISHAKSMLHNFLFDIGQQLVEFLNKQIRQSRHDEDIKDCLNYSKDQMQVCNFILELPIDKHIESEYEKEKENRQTFQLKQHGIMVQCNQFAQMVEKEYCKKQYYDLLQKFALRKKDDDDVYQEMMAQAYDVVDRFRHCIAQEKDLQIEAECYSFLGLLFDEVFKNIKKAKYFLINCVQIVLSHHENCTIDYWFICANQALKKIQKEQNLNLNQDDQDKETQWREKNADLIKELEEKKVDHIEYIKYCINKFVTKTKQKNLLDNIEKEGQLVKKCLLKCMLFLHPDKQQTSENTIRARIVQTHLNEIYESNFK